MRGKIIKTVISILAIVALFMVFNAISYNANQEYAYTAVDQLKDSSSAYDIMNTKPYVKTIGMICVNIAFALISWFMYKVWTQKKKQS